jgi:benzoylformate decarboxylase
MSTVREVTYELLRDLGMTVIFGNPGSSELPFLKDMPPDFQYVLGLHERTAAGMALGYAMARREPVFVNLHSIASAGNGLSAVIDAFYGHVPLVITTGQQDRRQLLTEPFLMSRAVEVVRPYVKWAHEPLCATDVPSAIAQGYYIASQPPQGPILISIPMDDWNHACPPLKARKVTGTASPNPEAMDELVRALNASRSPALVVGAQIEEDGAWDETIALAEHLDAEVYQEPIPSRWVFPRSHRLFRGSLPPAQRPLSDLLANYDVVVVLGAPVFLYYTYVPGDPVRPSTGLFQITNSPADAARAQAGTSIVGNLASAIQYVRSHAEGRKDMVPPGSREGSLPAPADYPITADFLFSTLQRLLPPDAIIVEECPSSKGDLDRNLRLEQPRSFYSVRTGILGFGLPTAVGLQLANSRRRVICPVGDGSAQYSIQALWSAAQCNARVIFIVIQNGDYSALKGFCDFTNVGRNVPGMNIPGIDMVKIADGYGVPGCRVERPEELEPALRRALAASGPYLVNVNVRSGVETCMGMDKSVDPPDYG